MGILDDAIREHLDLKRRQGVEDNELARLEDEAFGPPTRPGDPDFPDDEPAAAVETAVAEPPSEGIPAAPEASAPPVAPPGPPEAAEAAEAPAAEPDELDLELDLDLDHADEAPPPPPEAPSEEASVAPVTDEQAAVGPEPDPPAPEPPAPPEPAAPPIESLDTVEHEHTFEPPIESL